MFNTSFHLLLFSHSVMSDSLQPNELQHTRPPCPSPYSGACSNSCPLSLWCHPTISSSVIPFSSRLQSFPILGSFLMIQLFTSGTQSIGASASVLPMNIQGWFPLGLTGLISLLTKGLSRVFSSCHRIIDHKCVSLFLVFLYCSTDQCVCFCASTILFGLLYFVLLQRTYILSMTCEVIVTNFYIFFQVKLM